MPASQLFHQSPVADIRGTKRKADLSSETEFLCSDFEGCPIAKQICRCPDELPVPLNQNDVNSLTLTDDGMKYNFTTSMALCADSCIQDNTSGNGMNCSFTDVHEWPTAEKVLPTGFSGAEAAGMEVDHAMQLGFCVTELAQGVPDYSIHKPQLSTESVIPSNVAHRCYCRPAWDGAALMRSSLSDYY